MWKVFLTIFLEQPDYFFNSASYEKSNLFIQMIFNNFIDNPKKFYFYYLLLTLLFHQ